VDNQVDQEWTGLILLIEIEFGLVHQFLLKNTKTN